MDTFSDRFADTDTGNQYWDKMLYMCSYTWKKAISEISDLIIFMLQNNVMQSFNILTFISLHLTRKADLFTDSVGTRTYNT